MDQKKSEYDEMVRKLEEVKREEAKQGKLLKETEDSYEAERFKAMEEKEAL